MVKYRKYINIIWFVVLVDSFSCLMYSGVIIIRMVIVISLVGSVDFRIMYMVC